MQQLKLCTCCECPIHGRYCPLSSPAGCLPLQATACIRHYPPLAALRTRQCVMACPGPQPLPSECMDPSWSTCCAGCTCGRLHLAYPMCKQCATVGPVGQSSPGSRFTCACCKCQCAAVPCCAPRSYYHYMAEYLVILFMTLCEQHGELHGHRLTCSHGALGCSV